MEETRRVFSGSHDVFLTDILQGQKKPTICVALFDSLQEKFQTDTSRERIQYDRNLKIDRKVSVLATHGIDYLRSIITTVYARLESIRGQPTLTIPSIFLTCLRAKKVAKVVFFNQDQPEQKAGIILKNVNIEGFESDDEFTLAYCAAAHRLQGIALGEAIFRQSTTNLIAKPFADAAHKAISNRFTFSAYLEGPYKKDETYDKERDIQKKRASSNEPKPKKTFFSKSQIKEEPARPFFRINPSTSHQPAVEGIANLIDEIDKRLAMHGVSRQDGSSFSLSIHFKHSSNHAEEIIFYSHRHEFKNSRKYKEQKMGLYPLSMTYAVPFEIDLQIKGSSEKFEFHLITSQDIAKELPRPSSYSSLYNYPKTLEEFRETNNYEVYLYAVAFKDFFITAMNRDALRYVEANKKLAQILCEGHKMSYKFSPHSNSSDRGIIESNLKSKFIQSVGITCKHEDPAPFIIKFEERRYVVSQIGEKKFTRLKAGEDKPRKAKIVKGWKKIAARSEFIILEN